MIQKLREMKEQLRSQIQNSNSKDNTLSNEKQKKQIEDAEEDNQGYESYQSPEAKSNL